MAIAFHPKIYGMLAGGTYNGDVVLWDISNDTQPILTRSITSHLSHVEPISSLIWSNIPHFGTSLKLVSAGNSA